MVWSRIFLRTSMRFLPRWTTSYLDMQHNQQWHPSNIQHIVGCLLDQQCFHWSLVLDGGICLDIQRWWLVSMLVWWYIHLQSCTNIGCSFRWIVSSMASMLDSKLVLQDIARSSFCSQCMFVGQHIWSFHQLFLCKENQGMKQLVVLFQWLVVLSMHCMLKKRRENVNWLLK